MCCSVTPGVKVRFSDTVLYAAEVMHLRDGEVVHVLGYQNKVQGRTGLFGWWPWGGVGNAMILPFPAQPGSMTRANVIDTGDCPRILQEMWRTPFRDIVGTTTMTTLTMRTSEP